ncbi:MAG TPA: glycosyltransferase [Chryseosolibacter sp.]
MKPLLCRMGTPRFSVVVPVYNRPDELRELLASLTRQTITDFEVVVVEDGSSVPSKQVVDEFSRKLQINYFFKPNSGPGPSRNAGFQQARGDYFVIFDSDCILPENYFHSVVDFLSRTPLDAWGGPDRAHENFTILQRAMGYTMSSPLTTGGIRGGKKHVGWFQPRSFNMGISRNVFQKTGGFHFDRYAEDIEFSIRMKQMGFRVGLIPDAFVYHKRRTTLGQFFRQVSNFGKGRALIGRKYPSEVKLTHWFPTIFLVGLVALALLPLVSITLFWIGFTGLVVYLLAIFLHSFAENRSFLVALLSVPSVLIQFCGYGIGFLQETLKTYSGK